MNFEFKSINRTLIIKSIVSRCLNPASFQTLGQHWDKINIDGAAKVSDLVLLTALQIADAGETPQFASLPSRPPAEQSGGEMRLGTYLGTVPDYGIHTDGVRLAGVSEGSPAARAGLREGDVIVQLADMKIRNIEDLMAALQAHKPGDEVEIVVLRTGSPVKLKATLRSRG
jgi:S1-C subfamily serine protease